MTPSAPRTPTGEAPFDPAVLRAFGEVARLRFGLARMERNPAGLARRLTLALGEAQVERSEATRFIDAIRSEPDASPVVQAAADAITNRETWFFREHAQLEGALASAGRANASDRNQRLRALCAGCATGEEPLSVAMLALDAPHLFWGGALDVTGFDLSPGAIERARAGAFRSNDLRRAEPGPLHWESRFFRRDGDELIARSWLTGRVRFEVQNLLGADDAFERGAYDLVLCRNVLIYFDEPAVSRAMAALAGWVRPGGVLVLGAAEAGLAVDRRLVPTSIAGVFRREDGR